MTDMDVVIILIVAGCFLASMANLGRELGRPSWWVMAALSVTSFGGAGFFFYLLVQLNV